MHLCLFLAAHFSIAPHPPLLLVPHLDLLKKTDNDPEPKFLVTFSPVDGPDVPENYTEIVFPQANFSVILKNLQKANSGLYDAQLSTSKQEILVAYNITVLDPVSPVKVKVDPVSSSPDSCNVTVSCTTDDYTISSTWTCTNQTCSNQGHNSEITPLGASLHIYLSDDSVTIICNHSNQVDWITASAHISPLCPTSPVYISSSFVLLFPKSNLQHIYFV
uniref:Ig-like domain-containing protein n=1 Tax=Sphaeramia orbicularis TaxID=375764 RepID=A0A673AAK1_9TELE